MKSLELKIPPAFLMLVFAVVMWQLDRWVPGFKQTWEWREWAARAVFLLALGCIISGMASFKLARTTVDPTRPENASSVVTTGIYRFTRNPMYLGFLLILASFVFKLANPITAVLLPLFVIYMNRFQILPEERTLIKLFGDAYEKYVQQVNRWI